MNEKSLRKAVPMQQTKLRLYKDRINERTQKLPAKRGEDVLLVGNTSPLPEKKLTGSFGEPYTPGKAVQTGQSDKMRPGCDS